MSFSPFIIEVLFFDIPVTFVFSSSAKHLESRLTRIRVIERFGGRPYVTSFAHAEANMGVIPKQIRSDGLL